MAILVHRTSQARSQAGRAAADAFYQEHRGELLAGTQVLWARPDAYREMMLFRLSRGEPAFWSEVMNQPSEAGGALGKIPRIGLPSDLSEWMRVGALDPTVRGGKRNDLSAWVEAYFHMRRKELILCFCDAKQRPASQTIEFVVNRLCKATKRFDGLWVEANSAGTLIADSSEQRIEAEGLNYAITQINNLAPKDERIFALSEYAARSQLFIAGDIDPEFINEWEGYPGYRWDDTIDAASTNVLQLKKAGLLDLV